MKPMALDACGDILFNALSLRNGGADDEALQLQTGDELRAIRLRVWGPPRTRLTTADHSRFFAAVLRRALEILEAP